ncbi:leucine-rich repeat domain-containing protein [Psychromicrobium sp. YIM B11713]|uniref:leucine-rich repeat domain-containing protein n=1 Tax=Psychromicrobium sp. YIM B11713 TaxID=3145233 RepID=UPI00374EB831
MKKRLSITAAAGLIAIAASLLGAQPAAAAGIDVQDVNLKECINEQLEQSKDADITQEQALTIEKLTCTRKISTLSGIAQLSNLKEFSNFVRSPALTDLRPLSGLTKLQEITIWGSSVTDLSPLKNLPNLTELVLTYSKISNVSSLGSMTQLKRLNLDGNQITDFSELWPLLAAGTSILARETVTLPPISVGVTQWNQLTGMYRETPVITLTNAKPEPSSAAQGWFYIRANQKNILTSDFSATRRYPANVKLSVTLEQASLASLTSAHNDIAMTKYQTPITIDVSSNDGDERQTPMDPNFIFLIGRDGSSGDTVEGPEGNFRFLPGGKVVFTPAPGFSGAVPRVKYYAYNLDEVYSTAYIYVTVGAKPAAVTAKPDTTKPHPVNTTIKQTPTDKQTPTASAASASSDNQKSALANTGADPALPLSLAGFLLLSGVAALYAARRRVR